MRDRWHCVVLLTEPGLEPSERVDEIHTFSAGKKARRKARQLADKYADRGAEVLLTKGVR